jgi:hypothetical protein
VSAPTTGGRKKERERDERKTEKGWDRDIVGLRHGKKFWIKKVLNLLRAKLYYLQYRAENAENQVGAVDRVQSIMKLYENCSKCPSGYSMEYFIYT